MWIINGVPPRTSMDNFYIEKSILTVKHIFNYNIGLFMFKYVNNMTPDVFDNFFRNVSDIHQHNTRNTTQNLLYVTFRGTTRGQLDNKLSNTVVLIFGISSSKILIQTVQLAHLKNILVNHFLPLKMISCKLIHNQLYVRSGAVMAWSNSTWYYVSMAWCGTAVTPLLTHWSCCSLAVGHRYNTVATGLGRKQSSNKNRHPISRPHRWALGCLFFEDLWNLPCYDGTATALKSCLSVFSTTLHLLHP